jgi:ATP-dependent DNA helicase RecQ
VIAVTYDDFGRGTEELKACAVEHTNAVVFALAGPDASARGDQLEAVSALVVDGARVLVVQATGWGKSLVYWAATSALRSLGRGPTLVVSPLLALMRDQVTAAERAGLRAVTVNSTNVDVWGELLAAVERDEVDVLLVSPERLSNPSFAHRMEPVIERAGLIVIDEAHCISDWGFDFRPDYQRVAHVLAKNPTTPVLATTATANGRVTSDVATQLGTSTLVLRGTLARSSLRLSVVPGLGPIERLVWVSEALHRLAGSGIIYVPTVAETARVAGFLAEQGHDVAAYSGQLEPDRRVEVEAKLRAHEVKAVVATSALGMGYDMPDLSFCIHLGSPDSPVAYYQQVGRAGRKLDRADAILLPAETDERLWAYFATASIPEEADIEKTLATLNTAQGAMSVPALEADTGIRRGRLEALLRIVAVEGAVARVEGGWVSTNTPYVYDASKWASVIAARASEADLMRRYAAQEGCLMQFLQLALDDLDPARCGRCSFCTGEPAVHGIDLTDHALSHATSYLRNETIRLEPRKRWPSGLRRGFAGSIRGPEEGRALFYADAPAWRDAAQRLTSRDAVVSGEVLDGMVSVLSAWRATWTARPIAVVPMPSRGHRHLIWQVAEHIARVGNLEIIDALNLHGEAPDGDLASRARVERLIDRLSVRDDVVVSSSGPLLLIDDTYRTGWTMTVAAALLRNAGASSVLPLVIHQLP